jgi:hypothetical protein
VLIGRAKDNDDTQLDLIMPYQCISGIFHLSRLRGHTKHEHSSLIDHLKSQLFFDVIDKLFGAGGKLY